MQNRAKHQVDTRALARPTPPRRRARWWLHLLAFIDRIVSVGIVSHDPDVRRRQRFVNTAALVGGIASLQHSVEQLAWDAVALQPLVVHNFLFALIYLATPLLHRVSENAAALYLCAAVTAGTARVIWLTGIEGGAHVYFAFTAAAFLFFGVQHWRLFLAVVLLAFTTVVTAVTLAPHMGPVALAAPDYVEHLSAMIVVNVMIINVWLFTYALVKTHRAERQLEAEVARSDGLLLAILPRPIANRLKVAPGAIVADRHEAVTVFFADLVGFTTRARTASPEHLVAWLDTLFKGLDALASEHKVEKIKTIGDAYMAVSGLRVSPEVGAERVARFALAFRDFTDRYGGLDGGPLQVRIGLHTGPVVAGVIGGTRFAYDMWGDAVNTASRMESHGEPGLIQLSAATADLLTGRFAIRPRGVLPVKGLGEVEVFWLDAVIDVA